MNKFQWTIFVLVESILISLIILIPNRETIFLFIIMQLQILVVRKAKHIKMDAFNGADWLRRSVYFIFYLLPFYLYPIKSEINKDTFIWSLFAILVGILILIPRIKEISPHYNKELSFLFPPLTFRTVCLEVYSYVASAIFQELFYKSFILLVLYSLIGPVYATLVSSFLFMADHALHFAAKKLFQPIDYISQFVLSAVGGVFFIYSGSVFIPIILHLTFNAPLAFANIVRYYWIYSSKRQVNA